jgi:hypothetical protein
MIKLTRFSIAVVAIAMSMLCVAGCGGGGSSGDVVAQVGSIPISKATLVEWMEAVTGGDYYEHLGTPAPRGLVSDPPNYPRCVKAAEKIVPRSANGQSTLSKAQIEEKCRLLQVALKEQALELLISIDSEIGQGQELGVPATPSDVSHLFAEQRAREFPKQAEYARYLALHEWTPTIEKMQLERNVVETKVEEKFTKRGGNWTTAYVRFLRREFTQWTAKTTCKPGYVILGCKEHKASTPPPDPAHAPAILLEELAGRA